MPIYPGAFDRLEADLDRRLGHAAAAAAEIVQRNLEVGPRSGVHYPTLPRRSSAVGEYPQQQFGALRASIGFTQVGPLHWAVGAIHQTGIDEWEGQVPGYARDLEFYLRPWLSPTMENAETWGAMLVAMENSGEAPSDALDHTVTAPVRKVA